MTNDQIVLKPGIYRHYKGNLYEVMGIVTHSETREELVLYKPLYGKDSLWVRPKEMFMEILNLEGKEISRFEFVE